MAYPIKKCIIPHDKKSRDKGALTLVIQQHNASIKKAGSFYLSPLPCCLCPQAQFSLGCKMAAVLVNITARHDNVQREKETSFSYVCFLFSFKGKLSQNPPTDFLTPHWLELHPCHHLNQLLSRGMGSWPIPGAGAKNMQRQPTVSAFPRLPLPWTSDSKAWPKKYVLFPPSPHCRRRTAFQKNKFWCVNFSHYTLCWKHSQWAHLCGLV